jgi:opacity protein-like surface antigen
LHFALTARTIWFSFDRYEWVIAMLRNVLISASVFLIGLSLAASASAQQSRFEGLYIGAQGHYSYIKADLDVSGVGSDDDNLDGFGGSGFIGFGGTDRSNTFYGGLEIEGGYDNADWNQNIGGTQVEAEAEWTAGISARLGVVMAERYLLYVRGGYQGTQGKLNVSGFGSEDEWINGFRFGGGLEGFVTENIALRADYTYTIYEDPTNISGVDLDLTQHLVRVGAGYYF